MRPESTAGRALSVAVAVSVLVGVRIALSALPFAWVIRHVERLASIPIRLPGQSPARVGARVARISRRVPGAACLAQALAARVLLSWHGHDSTVRYGVRRDGGVVEAHAWVEARGRVVVGGPDVSAFTPLETARAPHAH